MSKPRAFVDIQYEEAAQAYLRSLPLEHFMEATAQAKQREITLESLALVTARRPDFQVFNELLVQYPQGRQQKPAQVVPDNMVVIWKDPIKAQGSFNLPLQPAGPWWVLEYVSKFNKRKNYEDNFERYERALKVPYYLLFYPDVQDLTLYHHTGRKYVSVKPNENDRFALPEQKIEVVLVNGWVRYWYQGKMLPLPGEMQTELEQERQARKALERELEVLRSRLGSKNGS